MKVRDLMRLIDKKYCRKYEGHVSLWSTDGNTLFASAYVDEQTREWVGNVNDFDNCEIVSMTASIGNSFSVHIDNPNYYANEWL